MDRILCALFHKRIIVVDMDDVLDKKIENVLDQADRMFIACLLYTSPSPRD